MQLSGCNRVGLLLVSAPVNAASMPVNVPSERVVEHAVDVVVDVEVCSQGSPGQAGGATVVRPEGGDQGDEGGEGDDDVHGRKSART